MPAPTSSAATTVNWPSLITIASATVLIGTELFGAAWASGWALAGFFQLGSTIETGLQTVFGFIALFVMVVFVRQAIRVEPILTRV
jgi:hypothetical protein